MAQNNSTCRIRDGKEWERKISLRTLPVSFADLASATSIRQRRGPRPPLSDPMFAALALSHWGLLAHTRAEASTFNAAWGVANRLSSRVVAVLVKHGNIICEAHLVEPGLTSNNRGVNRDFLRLHRTNKTKRTATETTAPTNLVFSAIESREQRCN